MLVRSQNINQPSHLLPELMVYIFLM